MQTNILVTTDHCAITTITPDQLESVHAILSQSNSFFCLKTTSINETSDILNQYAFSKTPSLFAINLNEDIVGLIYYASCLEDGKQIDWIIDSQHKFHGIVSEVIDALISKTLEDGYDCYLDIDIGNQTAISLAHRNQFKFVNLEDHHVLYMKNK